MKLSDPVRTILDLFKRDYGELLVSDEDASRLYLGAAGGKVADLSDKQLLQLSLCQAHDAISEILHQLSGANLLIETLENRLAKQPNREQRRHP